MNKVDCELGAEQGSAALLRSTSRPLCEIALRRRTRVVVVSDGAMGLMLDAWMRALCSAL
jgi:hypothetical protein